jgi:hypothetical protein
MTMHLVGPALSLNGKKKGKKKFRNAEEARKARELASEWDQLKSKWAVPVKEKKMGKVFEPLHTGGYKLSAPVGRETQKIKSLSVWHTGALTVKQTPQYTGTKVIGIGTMHKSNAVPIFSDEEAVEISQMRRS